MQDLIPACAVVCVCLASGSLLGRESAAPSTPPGLLKTSLKLLPSQIKKP